ncbi:MAG: glycosyltransferase [Candidatus Omnitrophota bacterium]
MITPFFSIIIPTYNRKDFLPIAMESVIEQTFSDYELIIVDDGSTDGTKKAVNKLNDPRINKQIKYFWQPHEGVSAARNKGIKESRGGHICFLDSDDRFRQDKLQVTHDCIKKNPEYKIFHTEEIWYRSGELLPQKIYHKKPHGWIFRHALKLCCISPSTVTIGKDVFKEIGNFDTNLPVCEDYDLWLRAALKFPVFLIPEPLTIKEGGHADQQSKKYPAMDTFRIYALKKILQNGNLTKENYSLAAEELRNKCSIYIQGARKRAKHSEVKKYQELLNQFT